MKEKAKKTLENVQKEAKAFDEKMKKAKANIKEGAKKALDKIKGK